MGGYGLSIAKTTHFRFVVSVSTGSGFQYRGLSIYKLRDDGTQEWALTPTEWDLSEEEQSRLREALNELEAEREAVSRYAKMTEEQKTLSEIWHRMCEAERAANAFRRRMEEAETALSKLRNAWSQMEEREKAEKDGEPR